MKNGNRRGAHWGFNVEKIPTDGEFPASGNGNGNEAGPGPLRLLDPKSNLTFTLKGPSNEMSGDSKDFGIRTTGQPKSCLELRDFQNDQDRCILDPGLCATTGFSFSLWLKIAPTFSTENQFILDSGATTDGGKGVSIKLLNSVQGTAWDQEMTILLSTGAEYWRVIINGMLKYGDWENLGVRWKPDAKHGLQVFTNKEPTAWRISSNEEDSSANVTQSDRLTIGCKLDGSSGYLGQLRIFSIFPFFLFDINWLIDLILILIG